MQGAAKKYPKFIAVFSTIAWNFKAIL